MWCCNESPAGNQTVEVQSDRGNYAKPPEPELQPKVVEEPPQAEPEPVVKDPSPQPVIEKPAPEEPTPPQAAPEPVQVHDGKVEFGFTDETGKKINFRFGTKPLGMNFALETMPIVITSFKPGSVAQECGVKVGMTLTTIEGEVVKDIGYSAAWQKLNDTLNNLPNKQV